MNALDDKEEARMRQEFSDAGDPHVGYVTTAGLTRIPEEIVRELDLPETVVWARRGPGIYGVVTLRELHRDDEKAAPKQTPADTPTGFDRAPDRYTAGGTQRDTVDEMRDLAHEIAGWTSPCNSPLIHMQMTPDGPLLPAERWAQMANADAMFAFHCDATALKYERRVGRKGSAEEDTAKARWYRAMAAHARGEGPDPRAGRPDFQPYRRPETT